MSKILVGMAAAALWFVFSQAADAERICKDVCNNGICVSRCVNNRNGDEMIIREHNREPGVELRAPGADVDVDR
jgi:hypothetical protein